MRLSLPQLSLSRQTTNPSLTDTFVVPALNDADSGLGSVFSTNPVPYEKSKSLGSGGSMIARLKLKEIDGRAHQ